MIYDVKEQKSRIANEEADVISDAVKKGVQYFLLKIFIMLPKAKLHLISEGHSEGSRTLVVFQFYYEM